MRPYVYITRKLSDTVIAPLRQKFTVNMWGHEEIPVPKDVLQSEAKKADGLLTMLTDAVDESVLSAGQQLKVVANMAVGYDNVDIQAASREGIAVCNTPDVLTDSTADLTFALLMATARRIVEAAQFVKEDRWKSWSPFLLAGHDIHHKTIGIVGMGKIGAAVARRAAGFEMNILYHNRTRKTEIEEKTGAVYASFDELVEQADFIVCLTPLTSETRNMFTRNIFQKMKRTAIFINASRGPVVNEQDLFAALAAGEIAGSGLDVFEQEPIHSEHPLLTLPNVVALPHIGSSTIETRTAMMKLCVDNIEAVLTGKRPKTLINKEWLQKV